ncbi:MAG TPA: spore coat protein [Ureibacillus sp.]|nr:spore coat protein [Ureibacillus sp.]
MSEQPKAIPNKVVDLLVSEVFRKNNVNVENAKTKLSEDQKQAIKDLVEELKSQVDTFVKQTPETPETSETPESKKTKRTKRTRSKKD